MTKAELGKTNGEVHLVNGKTDYRQRMEDWFANAARQEPWQNNVSGWIDGAIHEGLATKDERVEFGRQWGAVWSYFNPEGSESPKYREDVDVHDVAQETGIPVERVVFVADMLVAVGDVPVQKMQNQRRSQRASFGRK